MISHLRRPALVLFAVGICAVIVWRAGNRESRSSRLEQSADNHSALNASDDDLSQEDSPRPVTTVSWESAVPADPAQAQAAASAPPENLAAERDRLWQEAREFAAQKNWDEAVRCGEASLKLQRAHFVDQPDDTCRMLELTSSWYSRQRDFPRAVAAARERAQLMAQVLGDLHWQAVDARQLVALNEHLAKLTEEEWAQFLDADKRHAEAADFLRAGRYQAALDPAQQALRIYRDVLGREIGITLTCLSKVIYCHLELGRYTDAYPLVQELIEPQIRVKGLVHPETIDCLRLLARFNEATGHLTLAEDYLRKIVEIYEATIGPNRPDTLVARAELGRICSEQGHFAEAGPMLAAALQQKRAIFGDEHPATANTMKLMGAMYARQRNFAEAEPLLIQSVAIFRKHAGDQHLATASALNVLGKMRMDAGQWGQSERDLMESLATCRNVLGQSHPITAMVMGNLAELYELSDNPGPCRELRADCLRIAEQSCGENSLPTADALEHLAQAHISMNNFALAETYLLRAREIRRTLLGEEDSQTATAMSQLGFCYSVLGLPDLAKPLLTNALASFEKSLGPDSLEAAKVRRRIALLSLGQNNFEEAERYFREAIRSIEKQDGSTAYATASAKVGLAKAVLLQGRFDEARRLMDEAFRGCSELAPDDPEWIDLLGVGGLAYLATGDSKSAERMLGRGLRLAQLRMDIISPFSSENHRLALLMRMRNMFDLYLSLPSDSYDGESIYPHLLAWKGAVAVAQWRDRQSAGEESGRLIAELGQIGRSLSTVMLHVPAAEDREQRLLEIFNLNMRKETVEEQLAIESSKQHGRPIEVSVTDVRRILPPRTALIDFLAFARTFVEEQDGTPQVVQSQHCLAFIVRVDRPVVCVDLGELAPIAEAAARLQQSRGFRPNKGKTDWGVTVGELVWSPLAAHLDGCDTVLISPDGVLTRVPWSLLPGREAGRYLIEDFAIGLVAVPQLMPALFAANHAAEGDTGMPGEALLLVGDVDYDAGTPSVTEVGTGQVHSGRFGPLKGTAAEVQALRNQFAQTFPEGQVLLLDKALATEEGFRREATRHRWLHIATHGFFEAPSIPTAAKDPRINAAEKTGHGVSIFDVGVLNGLAMAGANVGTVGDGDNGILTAMELSTMDLRSVDVVVLSGCETGLGEAHTGEGTFGLQRALQTAGVGATVASLWTVSDQKTNLLMQRFYANLWSKKLSRLDALREAQLWMLNTGGSETTDSQTPAKRTSPHYWAAFSLSGDWR